MLNFENEMRAVGKGYVVLPLEEYDRLRDEAKAADRLMAELVTVTKQSWDDTFVVELDKGTLHAFAKKKFEEQFADALSEYEVTPSSEFYTGVAPIARRREPDADDAE